MREIAVTRRSVTESDYILNPAEPAHAERLIDESCVITENGKPIIAYIQVPYGLESLQESVKQIRYEKSTRSGGLPTVSRIFGYNPRSTLRKDFCSSTSLAMEQASHHQVVCDAGKLAAQWYEKVNQPLYQKHLAITKEKVLPEYAIPGTPFTSGIINKNNVLRYHKDNGNFKDVWSAMFVFKRDVQGGHLVVPEINCTFALRDKSLFLFDGQGLIHGVTPIEFLSHLGYRYTVVYYSLLQIWKCQPVEDEIKRIRALKTQRERKRTQPAQQEAVS